jgi:hypothetical protein
MPPPSTNRYTPLQTDLTHDTRRRHTTTTHDDDNDDNDDDDYVTSHEDDDDDSSDSSSTIIPPPATQAPTNHPETNTYPQTQPMDIEPSEEPTQISSTKQHPSTSSTFSFSFKSTTPPGSTNSLPHYTQHNRQTRTQLSSIDKPIAGRYRQRPNFPLLPRRPPNRHTGKPYGTTSRHTTPPKASYNGPWPSNGFTTNPPPPPTFNATFGRPYPPMPNKDYFATLYHIHQWTIAASKPHPDACDLLPWESQADPFWHLLLYLDNWLFSPATPDKPKAPGDLLASRLKNLRLGRIHILHARSIQQPFQPSTTTTPPRPPHTSPRTTTHAPRPNAWLIVTITELPPNEFSPRSPSHP